jgi:acetyl-CoA acetyltransferase
MSWQSLKAKVYMERFGVTNEDFGRVVVQQRVYAAANPDSYFYQRPIPLEVHYASPWIVEPVLRKFDCCQEGDDCVAIVLTNLQRARDLKHMAVKVNATIGGGNGSQIATNHCAGDLSISSESFIAAKKHLPYGIYSLRKFQVAELYDAYSCSVLY